jgi:hypothetical protein
MAGSVVKKCAHPSCRCQVGSDGKYCSELCRNAGADETEIGCDCGHPDCANNVQA